MLTPPAGALACLLAMAAAAAAAQAPARQPDRPPARSPDGAKAGPVEAMARAGADLAVIAGFPTPEQRRLVDAGIAALVQQAREAQTRDSGDDAKAPLLLARARLLQAARAEDGRRADLAREAAASVRPFDSLEPERDALRRLLVALGTIMAGSDSDAPAAELAALAAGDARDGDGVPVAIRVEAALAAVAWARNTRELEAGEARLRASRQQPPFRHADGSEDPVLALLAAEAGVRGRSSLAHAGPLTAESAARALEPLVAQVAGLVDAGPDTGLESTALAKLAIAARGLARGPSLDALPAPALVALALAPRDDGSMTPPADADRALTAAGGRDDAGAWAALALWELAVLRRAGRDTGAEQARRVAPPLLELARRYPDDPRADEALRTALAISGPGAGSTAPADPALYREGVALAAQGRPALPDMSAWRLERVRLAVLDTGDAGLMADEAGVLLEDLEAASAAQPDLRARADAIARPLLTGAVARAERAGDAGHRRDAARLALEWSERREAPERRRFRLVLGEALVDGADPGALEVLRPLEAWDGDGDPARRDRARFALARARRMAGDRPGAFGILRPLVQELEGAPGAERPVPALYWSAWAEMLEILLDDNAGGERTPAIRTHIERLALRDPAFGGGDAGARIGRVRAAVTGADGGRP